MLTQNEASPRAKLGGIEVARGVAALMVVLYHGHAVLLRKDMGGVTPFGGLFAFGHAGVEFFFVLSGFIILHVHYPDVGRPAKCASYIWTRATRVYPLFWFVLAVYAGRFILSGDFDWLYFVRSALLVPQPPYPMIIQAWTLEHEIFFYCIFALLILNLKLGVSVLCCWAAALMISLVMGHVHVPGDVARSPYNLLFFVGMAAAWLLRRREVPAPRTLATLGCMAFVATGLLENYGWIEALTPASVGMFGLATFILIIGLVSAERTGVLRVGRIGRALGRLSYPLYLIHSVVVGKFMEVTVQTPLREFPSVLLILYAAIAIISGFLLHILVEQPLQELLRKSRPQWLGGANPSQPAT